MKESEIQEAFDDYKVALSTSSRRELVARKGKVWPARIAFATAGAAVLTGSLLLIPRQAQGAAFVRVAKAVQAARSIETRCFMQRPSGKWVEYQHAYWQGSCWKSDVSKGTGLKATYTISDGKALTEYARLDHATLEPSNSKYFGEATRPTEEDPISFVKDNISMGNGQPWDTKTHPHAPVDARPTYAISFDRKSDQYHAEVLVDQATDLPFEAEASVKGPRDMGILRYRMEYRFNQTLPASMFALTSKKPIVDLPTAQVELTSAWEKTLWDSGSSQIRDVSVCPDGTIWVATTSKSETRFPIATDLTVDGTEYQRIKWDFNPSAILDKSKRYQFHGEDVYITGFVPVEPPASAPSEAAITLATRDTTAAGFAAGKDPNEDRSTSKVIHLTVRPQSTKVPDYFAILDLDRVSFQIPVTEWETRAEYLDKSGKFMEAAKAYEQTAVAYRDFVVYVGFKPLLLAAKDYRKANDEADAQRVSAESAVLKASQER